MRIGPVELTFHRTVRVADGRSPSNLPPSLGRMKLHAVSKYRSNTPKSWADDAFFMALHDVEAMWMSFHYSGAAPVSLLIGAGGINALTGEKLGTVLEKDNYLVAPPQLWLDGWKDKDGTVYQFVATPYKGGEGISIGEQLIGAESKTGAIGISVFEGKNPSELTLKQKPNEMYGSGAYTMDWNFNASNTSVKSSLHTQGALLRSAPASPRSMSEMGIGKGGKIIQKIYPDPYGLEVWKTEPSAIFAVYLVDAKTAEDITGESVPLPSTHDKYEGPWFGLQDEKLADVPGTDKFSGLKSAAFPGEKSNVEQPAEETVSKPE